MKLLLYYGIAFIILLFIGFGFCCVIAKTREKSLIHVFSNKLIIPLISGLLLTISIPTFIKILVFNPLSEDTMPAYKLPDVLIEHIVASGEDISAYQYNDLIEYYTQKIDIDQSEIDYNYRAWLYFNW